MTTINKCGVCGGDIEFDVSETGKSGECPHCGMQTRLGSFPPPPRIPVDPKIRLKGIRENTCYNALRTAILVGCVATWGFCAILALSGIAHSWLAGLYAGGFAILLSVLVAAIQQALSLMVDIADAVIQKR